MAKLEKIRYNIFYFLQKVHNKVAFWKFLDIANAWYML